MSVGTITSENGVVLHNATWQTYTNLRDSDENYRVRMTYDQGDLEVKWPSNPHEQLAYLTGRFIDIWTMETLSRTQKAVMEIP